MQVAEAHGPVFRADGVSSLLTRLHHNVLRTGLRRINLAYSRISLADIATKLHLQSAEDAGGCAVYMRAKATENFCCLECDGRILDYPDDCTVCLSPAVSCNQSVQLPLC